MNSVIVNGKNSGRAMNRGWVKSTSSGMLLPAATALIAFTAGCSNGSTMAAKASQPVNPAPPTINEALWVANGTNVLEYIPSQLSASPSAIGILGESKRTMH